MSTSRRTLLKNSAATAAVLSLDWTRARAEAETVRLGIIYDLTGPFAAGGSVASSVGAQIAIDLVNEKGGIGGKYKIAAIAADSQSKPDVAINEAERLINQEKLGIEPKDVKVALIHEDGPYGVGVAAADEAYSKQAGLQVVLKEGYSASAPDLSVLVTKIKRSRADVISHAGYNPDITLLLRQARENGLHFKMSFGAGAGYSQLDKLRATFGADIDNFCNIDPVPAQLLDPSKLAP